MMVQIINSMKVQMKQKSEVQMKQKYEVQMNRYTPCLFGCESCNKLLSQAKASLRNCLQSGLVGFFDDQQMKMKSIILTLRRSSRMQNAIQNTFHEILSSRFQTGYLFSLVFSELMKFHVNSSYFSYYTKNSSN